MPIHEADGPATDEQLRARTELLLKAAEEVSLQLTKQTEQLAEAIAMFDRDVVQPLRELKNID